MLAEHAALALPDTVGPMHAYANWLPYLRFPSLNEGGTPMTDAPALAGGQLTAASSVVVIGTAHSAREPAASLPTLLPSFG